MDANALNKSHRTPLQLASEQDQTQVIVALARNGADLNTQDKKGPNSLASRNLPGQSWCCRGVARGWRRSIHIEQEGQEPVGDREERCEIPEDLSEARVKKLVEDLAGDAANACF